MSRGKNTSKAETKSNNTQQTDKPTEPGSKFVEKLPETLRLSIKFNGTQARVYVNDAYFGKTQIDFADRYLFLGYQVMSGVANRPYIDISIDLPR